MQFDGLIFDLDGTLWDCSRASTTAFNLAYKKFSISKRVSEDFIKSIIGKPSSECTEMLLDSVSAAMRPELSRCFDELEFEAVQKFAQMSLYDFVPEGIEALSENYKLFVVSNCDAPYLEIFHRHTSVGTMIKDSECFGRTRQLKYKNICALVERQKLTSPCYIGDTASDEDAAKKAGVPFFHVSYGFGQPNGTPLAFETFKELTQHFTRLAHS